MLAISPAPSVLPIAGCTLLANPAGAIVLPGAALGTGLARWPAPIPELPILRGVRFYSQGLILSGASLLTTQGIETRI